MSELFIVVGLRAKSGKEDELRRDLIAVVEPSCAEEGSLSYDLYEDKDSPGLFVFVEHWARRETSYARGPHSPFPR